MANKPKSRSLGPDPDDREGSVAAIASVPPSTIFGSKPFPRQLDAEDFDRDEGPGQGYIGVPDPSSDMIVVPVGGRHYRMTETEAAVRGIRVSPDSIKTHPSPLTWTEQLPPSKTTHVLHQGSPLCRFSPRNPVDWPPGHEWVSLQHFLNVPEGALTGVTCDTCGERAVELRRSV